MKQNDKNRKALIQYRIEQAKTTIGTVELLIENNKLNAAVNRIYYGMFFLQWVLLNANSL